MLSVSNIGLSHALADVLGVVALVLFVIFIIVMSTNARGVKGLGLTVLGLSVVLSLAAVKFERPSNGVTLHLDPSTAYVVGLAAVALMIVGLIAFALAMRRLYRTNIQ
jgi:drug/metabolite transporter (DMT)-like permease